MVLYYIIKNVITIYINHGSKFSIFYASLQIFYMLNKIYKRYSEYVEDEWIVVDDI